MAAAISSRKRAQKRQQRGAANSKAKRQPHQQRSVKAAAWRIERGI